MFINGNLLIYISLAVFVGAAAVIPFSSRYGRGWWRWLATVAGLLLAIGATGFFGSALSATGGMDWLPEPFEWPVGRATGVVTTDDGLHIVPLTPSGRIQVYNPDWSFRTGWQVDAGGGTFKLLHPKGDRFDVITARGQHHYVFDTTGKLISNTTYAPETYGGFPNVGESLQVSTAPWKWPFTDPFHSWILCAAGGAILYVLQKSNQRKAAPDATP